MDLSAKRTETLARLRAKLIEIDMQTRLPGEPSLLNQVAEQARAEMAKLGR